MARKKKSEVVETEVDLVDNEPSKSVAIDTAITEKEYLQVASINPDEVEVVVTDSPIGDSPIGDAPKTPKVVEEVVEYKVYEDEEIVIFRNQRGHLKWGKYGYIAKQGYVALGTYQEYKAGKTF